MLTISSAMSADDAASYHGKDGLEAEGGFRGDAGGKGSAMLGLDGAPSAATVRALIRNRTPEGERLTQRDRHDKKPLTDFCFSPPKCVAILHQLGGDTRIPGEVMAAAMDVARQIEKRIQCRVKVFNKYREHTTGIAVILPDYHLRTRPVNGVSDPGDHVHVKFMNVTFWKGKRYSADLSAAVRDKALFQDMFHANLQGRMERLGYETYTNGRSFGVEGVTPAMVAKYSNRSAGITQEQARREASVQAKIDADRDPGEIDRLKVQLARIKAPKAKAGLGRKIREKKAADLMTDKLYEEWRNRMTPAESRRLGSATLKAMEASQGDFPANDAEVARNALAGLLGASSAVPEERLLAEALKLGVGSVSMEGLEAAIEEGPFVRAQVDGVDYVTTPEAMAKERAIVQFADEGGIRVRRTKRGDQVPAKPGELLIPDADKLGFDKLHEWVQKAKDGEFRLVLHAERGRLYSDKTKRGEMLNVLEDQAGLDTGQRPPGLLQRAVRIGRRLQVRMQMLRSKRAEFVRSVQSEVEHALDPGFEQRVAERQAGWGR